MAVTGLIKDRPDGRSYAGAMGSCYSIGKGKRSASLHRRSFGSRQNSPRASRQNVKLPHPGKARCPTSCKTGWQNTLSQRSTGKSRTTTQTSHENGGSPLRSMTATDGSRSETLPATLQARSGQVQDARCKPSGRKQDTSLSPSCGLSSMQEDPSSETNSTCAQEIPSCKMSIIRAFSEDETNGDGKSPEKPMGVFPESFPSLKNDVSSNNPNIDHQSESIKMPNATKTLPMVSSSHTEMKTPTLKPRVGGYEVLKPRRLVMSVRRTASRTRKQANSPTNKVSYVHKVDLVTAGKKSARTMDHSLLRSEMRIDDGKDLCKNCKVGKWESVCFISNDGKISAANTSPKGICHFHLCNPPRCSAGPNYNCSMSLPNKKEFHLSIEKASLPQNTNERGDEFHPTQGDLCSNTRSLLREKSATDTFSGDGEVESQTTELFLDDQTAKREDKYIGCCFQATDFVNMVKNSPSLEERQRSAFTLSERRDPKACGLMTPFKCSGHDFCSEHHDDSEVPSVNKQVMCGNLATKDSTFELNSIVQLQLRKPNMERMRQKYLYCLKQQEAERVPLRKQEMMSRKKAGEWMLDSAIGEILRKLAPGREAGVKLIIEAFETIMKRKNSEIEEKGRRSSLKLLRQS